MKKTRPAVRLGDPHSLESVSRVINRYGAIEDETFDAIVAWLDKHPDKYSYEIIMECGNKTIKTQRIGSAFFKITDNQKDASDTLENLNQPPTTLQKEREKARIDEWIFINDIVNIMVSEQFDFTDGDIEDTFTIEKITDDIHLKYRQYKLEQYDYNNPLSE